MPLIALLLVILDRVSKIYMENLLVSPGTSLPCLPHVFELYLAHNTGASFSLFSGHTTLLLILTGIMLLIFVIWLLLRGKSLSKLARLGAWCVIAGGIGNLIDRAFFGYVTDFINLLFIRFPVFNFADICVCIGAALLCIGIFLPVRSVKK